MFFLCYYFLNVEIHGYHRLPLYWELVGFFPFMKLYKAMLTRWVDNG